MHLYPITVEFDHLCAKLTALLAYSPPVSVGEWQAQKVNHDLQRFLEANNVVFHMAVGDSAQDFATRTRANIPWAEDHFLERVCGDPLNPPPSSRWWPYAQNGHKDHVDADAKFSHTYPERFWPKHANHDHGTFGECADSHWGIRFQYGDLQDVVDLLRRSPLTRQAYLPVWFPEDTGAVHGERVPCTLGYHFLIREGRLDCTYLIRSCDFYRHFRDDVYMAGRLMQWMVQRLNRSVAQESGSRVIPGRLTMHIMNLHAFAGDRPRMLSELREYEKRFANIGDGHAED